VGEAGPQVVDQFADRLGLVAARLEIGFEEELGHVYLSVSHCG